MKYILLLLSLSVSAGVKEDLDSLKSIGHSMVLCGYDFPNRALFKKKLISENDTVSTACLVSKDAEVISILAGVSAKKAAQVKAQQDLATADCATIPGLKILKDMCKALQ